MHTLINNYREMPLVALRGIVVFPNSFVSLDVGRPKSVKALDKAPAFDNLVFLTAQKNIDNADPTETDLYSIGTIARVKQVVHLPGYISRALVEGLDKAKLEEFLPQEDFFTATVSVINENYSAGESLEIKALIRTAHEAFETYATISNRLSPDAIIEIITCEDPGYLSYLLCKHTMFKYSDKQMIYEESNPVIRLGLTLRLLNDETDILILQRDIMAKVRTNADQAQKEYFLKEQMRIIKEELGDKTGVNSEISAYRDRIEKLGMPEYAVERLEKEFIRLERTGPLSPEGTVIRDYIDWVMELPWFEKTPETKNLVKSQNILNREHYGLEKVKERIIEFLAVRSYTKNNNSPIICLVGPPGVGKTSIAKSIASAMNRNFVRISLGGLRDEADIRGHRKTYIGAMPGRIIYAMRQAKSKNPLLLLDEIDKMSADFRGNPAAALLEVLDGEQNNEFTDHYVEIPFDLSDVLFVCTANNLEEIPPTLADRMEIIKLPGYLENEKLSIATKFLVPKQLNRHGLSKSSIKINAPVISEIINGYTKEAGVRQLERLIAQICRKAVKERLLDGSDKSFGVRKQDLIKYLGNPKYRAGKINDRDETGVARGLAWTPVGGETLVIEVTAMHGRGKIKLTGSMGKVMRESAHAAISYVRSRYKKLGLPENFYKNTDIHIHIPEGAVPKDGPSAGITMAVAIISALTGMPVRNNIGMTGEITIRGRVLPVGGLNEKIMAAKKIGLEKVIIPYDNQNDLSEFPEHLKTGIEFIFVRDMDDVHEIVMYKDTQHKCESGHFTDKAPLACSTTDADHGEVTVSGIFPPKKQPADATQEA